MAPRSILLASVALICGLCNADAAQPLGSSPDEVAKAYIAARDVGNIDAALAFFATDGSFQLTGGKKFTTRDELRRLHELFVHEQVHTADLRTVSVKDHTVTLMNDVSTAWLTQFGFAGMPVDEIVTTVST